MLIYDLSEVVAAHPDISFLDVDIDRSFQIGEKYDITILPTTIVFVHGKQFRIVKGGSPGGVTHAVLDAVKSA